MYLYIAIFVVLVGLLSIIDFFSIKTFKIGTSFTQIYHKESKILHYQFEELMGCLNIEPLFNCMRKDYEIFKTKYSKLYYIKHPFNLSFYDNMKLNKEIIIQPHSFNSYTNVIIIIPISPTQLLPRIAIRSTYATIHMYKNYIYKYIFVMGMPDSCDNNSNKCYSLKYLEDENNMFSDILVFNYTNSYKLITLQLLLTYKYILETYKNVKFVARANSDMFIKSDLLGKLISKYRNYDLIAYKVLYKKKLIYPCGAFYVLSKNIVKLFVDKYRYVKPIHDIEDVYYGEIMRKYNINNVKWINDEYIYICISNDNSHLIYLKQSLISIHEITSSIIIYLWKHFYEKKFHYFIS